MKAKIFLLLPLLGISLAYADSCPLKEHSELKYTDLECQLNLGKAAYRSEIYEVAAAHWKYIINSGEAKEEKEHIKSTALSTYSYLTYHGLGVEQNKIKAVQNWKMAVDAGELEARRFLGFAHFDQSFTKRDRVMSLGWYKSILLMHPTNSGLDEKDSEIWADAVRSVEIIERVLTPSEIKKSFEFAKSITK